MTTEAAYSKPPASPPSNSCDYSVPIRLRVPIYLDIEVYPTSQPVPPQLVVVPIQPDLQLTPKVQARQPECIPASNGGYKKQPDQQLTTANS